MTENNTNQSSSESNKAQQDKVDVKKEESPAKNAKPKAATKKVTSPEATISTTSQVNNENKKSGNKLSILALIVALLGTTASLYVTQQQRDALELKLVDLQESINAGQKELQSSVTSQQNALKDEAFAVVNRTEVTAKQQQESIESLQMALSEMQGRRPNDWLLAEADYLIKLASRKLILEKDVNTAIALMESADQRVATLNDPTLLSLRQFINDDLTALKSTPVFDKDGLALKLMSLQKQVDSLPLANAIIPEQEQSIEQQVSTDIADWQQNLMTSLKSFSEQFITFRTREGSVVPLLSPEQHFYLRENIKAKIDSAINATYSENQDLFDSNLELALAWTNTYFDVTQNSVSSFTKLLTDLSTTNITISYPTRLETQSKIEDVIKQRLRREVTTISTEDTQ
jgi:uroporphyrin-3 C-methyltransferase